MEERQASNTFFLLHDSLNATAQLFSQPQQRIECWDEAGLDDCFRQISSAQKQGFYVAGYFAFELGYCLSDKQSTRKLAADFVPQPLILLYAFARMRQLNSGQIKNFFAQHTSQSAMSASSAPSPSCSSSCPPISSPPLLYDFRYGLSAAEYAKLFAQVSAFIVNGDNYQTNLTFPINFSYRGAVADIYQKISTQQKVSWGVWFNHADEQILSFSPELFWHKQSNKILSKPMKGTQARGTNRAQDANLRNELLADAKNRAENVMIVDLLRNDLGKVAVKKSVRVSKLCELNTYPTVYQLTSSISAELDKNIALSKLLRAIFPCGSVVGTPKSRSLEIIRQLEQNNRGVYTGALGYLSPTNDMLFNVAIRTCILRKDGRATMGVGSAIVADSKPEHEYQECLLKKKFLRAVNATAIKLIESMRFEHASGGIPLLQLHIQRLRESARYFDFAWQEKKLLKQLKVFLHKRAPAADCKIRMLLAADGTCSLECHELLALPQPAYVRLSKSKINSNDILQKHKTTNRSLYLNVPRNSQFYDYLFSNEREELVEASRNNLIIKLNGKNYTPPLASGCLPGVKRQQLLAQGLLNEKRINLKELQTAQNVYLCNAVYGVVEVLLKN